MHVYKHSAAAGNFCYNLSMKHAILFKDSDEICQPQYYKIPDSTVAD